MIKTCGLFFLSWRKNGWIAPCIFKPSFVPKHLQTNPGAPGKSQISPRRFPGVSCNPQWNPIYFTRPFIGVENLTLNPMFNVRFGVHLVGLLGIRKDQGLNPRVFRCFRIWILRICIFNHPSAHPGNSYHRIVVGGNPLRGSSISMANGYGLRIAGMSCWRLRING